MKHMKTTITSATAFVALTCGSVMAEPISLSGQGESDWRYTTSFYAFLPARTSGDSTIAGSTVPLDLDLKDALDLLDWAAAGRFEAWKGDWGVILDANYVALDADGTLPSPGGGTFAADIRQKWFAILAGYKVSEGTLGNGGRYAFDIQGGARYNSLRQEITLSPAVGPTPPVLGGDEGWWEPVIGARGMWQINDRWTTIASVDVGGFGAGGNDLQIGANVGFDWRAWDKTSIFFGYRYYSMDYSDTLPTGAFAYDVSQHGPVIGVKMRF
ncbi:MULTISPECIES: hypothetical protein [Pseudomonadota]|uniref:outer membrane protein n=3 Tax=Pseudomonadota TaxID=1224 RepID=UPI00328DF289